MSQPEPTKRTVTAAPTRAPRPAPAPEPTPSRPRDATFAAGAARVAVDNQPGYDEQVRRRSPDGLDVGALTAPPGVAQLHVENVTRGIASLESTVGWAEGDVDELEAYIEDWISTDLGTAAASQRFEDAMVTAIRSERRRDLINAMVGVIDLTKAFTRLVSAGSVPSLAKMTDLSTATDVTKNLGTAQGVARGIGGEHQPSPALTAIAELGARVGSIEDAVDVLMARDVVKASKDLNQHLGEARKAVAASSRATSGLANVAPTSAVLPAARQSLADALRRMKRIEDRLGSAASVLRAVRRSRPATLARGGAVRSIVDAARTRPGSIKGLSLVQKTHLDVALGDDGQVITERPTPISFHIAAEGAPAVLRLEALGVERTEDIGALGATALGPVLGLPREELTDVTLRTASPYGPTKTIPAAEWLHDRDRACASFASLARQVDDYEAKSSVRYAR